MGSLMRMLTLGRHSLKALPKLKDNILEPEKSHRQKQTLFLQWRRTAILKNTPCNLKLVLKTSLLARVW